MNIQILPFIEGAKATSGLTGIIDVFRAISVEAYLFEQDSDKIIPVGDTDLAYRLKYEKTQFVLAGERHGRIFNGFDMGNYPSDNRSINFTGKTVVHTTRAGTQEIANAIYADEILGCGLVNTRVTAEYICRNSAEGMPYMTRQSV